MKQLGSEMNLVVCQKSKVTDWIEHFLEYHKNVYVYDLTKKSEIEMFFNDKNFTPKVGIINYDLIHRRPELLKLKNFTLMLDESSLIQNPTAKRTKTVLKLKADNVILLSGTPTDGKYERLWTQAKLLGWDIKKKMYFDHFVIQEKRQTAQGVIYTQILGYRNVERLKAKLREHGAVFMKTEEVLNLPEQNYIKVNVPQAKEYKKFRKTGIVKLDDIELVGDTTLTKLLYSRMLCGHYNVEKIKAFKDLVDGTNDRLVVFYNFSEELEKLKSAIEDKPCSIVNGKIKDLTAYENCDNSVTFIQYQAGSAGLNLQKANKMIYFTPPLSCEHWMQSAKRIHRIGTKSTCFYYTLTVADSVEEKIYKTLDMRENFTNNLFEEFENGDL